MLKPEDITAYLKQNPDFFEQHPDMLTDLEISSNQEPFHKRQLDVLRQRQLAQNEKYEMVVSSAKNNQALEQSLHELAQKLLSVDESGAFNAAEILMAQFSLEHARIWLGGGKDNENLQDVDFESLVKRVTHGGSICDDRVSSELLNSLFGDQNGVKSCAFVPLFSDSVNIGVMVLGASDPERFQPGMGAIYLDRMGQLVGAFLSRRS
jgi:uncharacterized protein YigA (DUF484 family)